MSASTWAEYREALGERASLDEVHQNRRQELEDQIARRRDHLDRQHAEALAGFDRLREQSEHQIQRIREHLASVGLSPVAAHGEGLAQYDLGAEAIVALLSELGDHVEREAATMIGLDRAERRAAEQAEHAEARRVELAERARARQAAMDKARSEATSRRREVAQPPVVSPPSSRRPSGGDGLKAGPALWALLTAIGILAAVLAVVLL